MLLIHSLWDIYTFFSIKYYLCQQMLFKYAIIINLDAVRRVCISMFSVCKFNINIKVVHIIINMSKTFSDFV